MKWRQKKVEKRTVLFVDDDEVVLLSLERGLQDESYNKLFVRSCNEVLEILQRQEVHIIVTDMRMPEMTGLELLRTVRKEYPHIIGIVLSGYDQDATLQTAVDQGEIFRLIPKPWKIGGVDFETLVRKAVDHYNLQSKCKQSGGRKLEKCKAKLRE
ncbi:MAG TPA: response regulator [Sedimentisphaerales bacterium]|nr:response regulator [Sedimentisphaerales bacterium]